MARGVGIEIGDHRVRVAVVESSAKRVKLVSFLEQPLGTDEKKTTEDLTADALRSAVAVSKARGRLVASLDSGDAILRELTLPFKSDDQIKKTYRFELESLIHNYSIEDLVCDYFKVAETEKGATILAAAVPRKIVESRLATLQKAGLDPSALDLDVTALFNAIAKVGAVDTDEPFLIVYGTARFTKIILVEKRRPRSIRTIRFSFPTAEAAEREQQQRRKDREWKTADLDKPPPIVILTEGDSQKFADLDLEQRASLIEILAKEISRFLLANAATAAPTHILLAGEYEVEEAAQMLEAGTQLPVKKLGILDRIEHSLGKAEGAAMRLPVAVGLALKACDEDELGLDFRRAEFTYGKKWESVKTTALVTLELVIVLLAAVALHFHFVGADYRLAHGKMLEYHKALYLDVLPGEKLEDPSDAFSKLLAKHRELQARFGGGDHPIERSALDLGNQFWRACWQLQQDSMKPAGKLEGKELYYLIEDMQITQGTQAGNENVTLRVKGVIQSVAYASALQSKLRAIDPFKEAGWEVKIPGFESTRKDGMIPFTIELIKTKKKP
jgi:Tfp pilus assembly PilM family ATPase